MPGSFISCDWGTTTMRLRLVARPRLNVFAEVTAAAGVSVLADQRRAAVTPEGQGFAEDESQAARATQFCDVLLAALDDLRQAAGTEVNRCPVLISGMASSSLGWRELPYGELPLRLNGAGLPHVEVGPVGPHETSVVLFSGLCADDDVLRGEETQAIGVLGTPDGESLHARGVVVLPGTHSKHIQVRDAHLVDFRTYMTGELFDLLSKQSILRHSVRDVLPAEWWSDRELTAAFDEGLQRGAAEPLSAALFSIRARSLLEGRSPECGACFLSGLLLGTELGDAFRDAAQEVPYLVCPPTQLHAAYARAVAVLGGSERVRVLDAEEGDLMIVRGHAVLAERLGRG